MRDLIKHVSDTSYWVAHYRAVESERADALFKDPFASVLVGDYAPEIEKLKSEATKWSQWTVVMRTRIIDKKSGPSPLSACRVSCCGSGNRTWD